MKLLVIGNSPKLIQFIESIFPIVERRVVRWRSLPLSNEEEVAITAIHWDILLIAGYDYQTAANRFEDYMEKNVGVIIELVKKCTRKEVQVIYTNTKAPAKRYTWSRYLYAKMRLGEALTRIFPNSVNLEFPTIVEHGRISTTGGMFSRIAFSMLDSLGLLSKVTINQSPEANLKLFRELKAIPIVPKPIFLRVRRPLIVDRFLRLVFG